MGMNVDQLPPSEALPGIGCHCIVFHNGLGFFYICKQFDIELENRLFECMKPGCRVTARMGEGCGSPLMDSGKHSHPPDMDYRKKCLLLHDIKQRFSMQEISASIVLRDALSALNQDESPPPDTFECVTVEEPLSPMLSEEPHVDYPPLTIKEEPEETPPISVIKEEIHVMDNETDEQNNTDVDIDDTIVMDDRTGEPLMDLDNNIDPCTDNVAIIDPPDRGESNISCGQKLNRHARTLEYMNSFRSNSDPRNPNIVRKQVSTKSASLSPHLGQGYDMQGTVVPGERVAAGSRRNRLPSSKLRLSLSGRCQRNVTQANSTLSKNNEATLLNLRGRVQGHSSGSIPENSSQPCSSPLREDVVSVLERLQDKLKEGLASRGPAKSSQHCCFSLTDEQEASLVDTILMLGFPLSRKQMLDFTYNWSKILNKGCAPNFVWLRGFLKRHPKVEASIRENSTNQSSLISHRKRQVNTKKKMQENTEQKRQENIQQKRQVNTHRKRQSNTQQKRQVNTQRKRQQNKHQHPYSKAQLFRAIEFVKSGMKIRKSAAKFGIPESTLRDYVRGKRKRGNRFLTSEEEGSIVERVTAILNLGFPVSTEQLIKIVTDQIRELNKADWFSKGTPNASWLSRFLRRHPDLAERLSTIDSAEKEIVEWFCET